MWGDAQVRDRPRSLILGQIRKTFYIDNYGKEDKTFKLEFLDGRSLDMSAPSGMEWGPADTEFKISPSHFKVKAGEKKKYKLSLKLPDKPEYYGKKYHYMVRVTPEGTGMTSGILLRINLATEGAKPK